VLNGLAKPRGYLEIEPIWKLNSDIPGARINIGPLIDAALALCNRGNAMKGEATQPASPNNKTELHADESVSLSVETSMQQDKRVIVSGKTNLPPGT